MNRSQSPSCRRVVGLSEDRNSFFPPPCIPFVLEQRRAPFNCEPLLLPRRFTPPSSQTQRAKNSQRRLKATQQRSKHPPGSQAWARLLFTLIHRPKFSGSLATVTALLLCYLNPLKRRWSYKKKMTP